MKMLIIVAVGVVAGLGVITPLAAQQSGPECGHCHNVVYPPTGDTLHVMTDDTPETHKCVVAGEPVHDCESGDGPGEYFPDKCEEVHQNCIQSLPDSDLALLRSGVLTGTEAQELADRYSTLLRYRAGSSFLRVFGCSGQLAMLVPVTVRIDWEARVRSQLRGAGALTAYHPAMWSAVESGGTE